MMRTLGSCVMLAALGLSSCTGPEPAAMGVHIELAVRQSKDVVRVEWAIRNREPEAIRVPVALNGDKQPLGFVTPTGDLVLVFGSYAFPGRDRPGADFLQELWHEWRWIPAGRCARGTTCLAVPFEPKHEIGNPYKVNPRHLDYLGERKTISEVRGLYLVAQYSKRNAKAAAGAAPGIAPWEDRMFRATLGWAMITGDMEAGPVGQVTEGVAVSRRVRAVIPLEEPVLLLLPERPAPDVELLGCRGHP